MPVGRRLWGDSCREMGATDAAAQHAYLPAFDETSYATSVAKLNSYANNESGKYDEDLKWTTVRMSYATDVPLLGQGGMKLQGKRSASERWMIRLACPPHEGAHRVEIGPPGDWLISRRHKTAQDGTRRHRAAEELRRRSLGTLARAEAVRHLRRLLVVG